MDIRQKYDGRMDLFDTQAYSAWLQKNSWMVQPISLS